MEFNPDKPEFFAKWIEAFECCIIAKIDEANFLRKAEDQIELDSEQGKKYIFSRFMDEIGPDGRIFVESQVIINLDRRRPKNL